MKIMERYNKKFQEELFIPKNNHFLTEFPFLFWAYGIFSKPHYFS